MPVITDLNQLLNTEVLKSPRGLVCKILEIPPEAQEQRGQICKLNALSTVLNWLHNTTKSAKPLPIRKDKKYSASIRELAKTFYNSKVGEAYSVEILVGIARKNGYDNTQTINTDNPTKYIETIKRLIDNGEAPIIFFDADLSGEPIKVNSEREHAAVVCGYFYNKQVEPCFIYTQWGKYYWAPAKEIAESALQLSSCREAETFYKYGKEWHEHNSLMKYQPSLFINPPDKMRQAQQLDTTDGGLKGKILIISKPIPSPSLLQFTNQENEKLMLEARYR